jgi:hypothetical protein
LCNIYPVTYRTSLQRGTLDTICELDGVLGEFRKTSDTEIFLVRARGFHQSFSLFDVSRCGGVSARESTRLFDTVKNIRLPLVVPVRADTEVDLAGVLVRLECLSDA